MRRIILGMVLVLLLAAGSALAYKEQQLTGNGNASDQQVALEDQYNRTWVYCDKEATGSVEVAIKANDMSDYQANATLDLTASDRSVVWQVPDLGSVNFSSSDPFSCKITQWSE